MPPSFNRIMVIGMGQIGASLGSDFVRLRCAREVIGVGRSRVNLRRALRLKAAHRALTVSAGVGLLRKFGANDLIVLAAPVSSIRKGLSRIPKRVLTMDVGSTKTTILKEADRRGLRFVGCHPIAGTEKSGAEAARPGLFRGRVCFVSRGRRASVRDLKIVSGLWKRLGARVEAIEAPHHDRIFSAVSHLPHAAAYSLIRVAARNRHHLKFAYTSLKDATRVALSSPEMWEGVFAENSRAVLKDIRRYQGELGRLASRIRSRRGILGYLTAARRDRFLLEK